MSRRTIGAPCRTSRGLRSAVPAHVSSRESRRYEGEIREATVVSPSMARGGTEKLGPLLKGAAETGARTII